LLEVAINATEEPDIVQIMSRLSTSGNKPRNASMDADTQVKPHEEELFGSNAFIIEAKVIRFDDVVNLSRVQQVMQKNSPRSHLIPSYRASRITSRRTNGETLTSHSIGVRDRGLPTTIRASRATHRKNFTDYLELGSGLPIDIDPNLAVLLRKALKMRPINYIIKDLYVDSASSEFSTCFSYLFSLGRSTPIESVKELEADCDIVIISPRSQLEFKLKRTGFNAEELVLFNTEAVKEKSDEAKKLTKNMEKFLKPRGSAQMEQFWSEQQKLVEMSTQQYLPNRLLNTLAFVSLPNINLKERLNGELEAQKSHFRDMKEADYKNTYKTRMTLPKHLSSSPERFKGNRSERIYSKNFIDDSNQLIKLRLLKRKLPTIHHSPSPKSIKSLSSPEKSQTIVDKAKLASMISTCRAMHFVNKGEVARTRSIKKLKERVIAQIGSVEAYCTRYALTSQEFASQLEEFAVLSLESSKASVGVHPQVLSEYYNTNIYALRGINPYLLDPSTVDKLDIRRIITPSMLLSLQEFTVFYSLAVTLRARESDILKYLFTLVKVTHTSQLKKDAMLEAIKSKFMLPHKFTVDLQLTWLKLTDALLSQLNREDYITIEEIVEAAHSAQLDLEELKQLVSGVFRSHSEG